MADAATQRMTKHQHEARLVADRWINSNPGAPASTWNAMEGAVDVSALGWRFSGGILRHG